MTDSIFAPGPNLRVARNDSGMSLLQKTHQDFDASMSRLLGTEPVLPDSVKNATNEAATEPQAQAAPPVGPTIPEDMPLYLPLRSVTDKVDPLDPSSYTEDVHTTTDGEQIRVQRAKPAPLPENPTLQDRLRRYSPVNGYAKYTAMAADRIDQQEKELQACRNLQMKLNLDLQAARIECERRQVSEECLTRGFATMNRLFMEASEGRQQLWDEKFRLEQHLNRLIAPGFFTRIFNALKGNK